jgi:hypothetical protein
LLARCSLVAIAFAGAATAYLWRAQGAVALRERLDVPGAAFAVGFLFRLIVALSWQSLTIDARSVQLRNSAAVLLTVPSDKVGRIAIEHRGTRRVIVTVSVSDHEPIVFQGRFYRGDAGQEFAQLENVYSITYIQK